MQWQVTTTTSSRESPRSGGRTRRRDIFLQITINKGTFNRCNRGLMRTLLRAVPNAGKDRSWKWAYVRCAWWTTTKRRTEGDKRVRVLLMIILEIGIISYVHIIIYLFPVVDITYIWIGTHLLNILRKCNDCYQIAICSYVIIWIRCKYFEIWHINTGCKHFSIKYY